MAVLTATGNMFINPLTFGSNDLIVPKITSSYREVITADDPLMFFPFDPDTHEVGNSQTPMYNVARTDKSDVVNDSFSNQIRRRQGNTFTFPTSATAGMEFDGASSMGLSLNRDIATGSAFGTPTAARPAEVLRQEKTISLEIWMRVAVSSGTNDIFCIGGGGGSNDTGIRLRMTNGGDQLALRFLDQNSVVQEAVALSQGLADNAWHHLVGTWDETDLFLYVDGVQVATYTAPASTEIGWTPITSSSTSDASGFVLKIGAGIVSFNSSSAFFEVDGFLNAPAFYAYPLTSAQVLAHYNAGLGAGMSTSVPAQPYNYARAEFPPNPDGIPLFPKKLLPVRPTTIESNAVGGLASWLDANSSPLVGVGDDFAVTVRVPREATSSKYDRKLDHIIELEDGAGTSLIHFGLCFDSRFSNTNSKAVKFGVYDGLSPEAPVHPTVVGGFTSTPVVAIDDMWDFEWDESSFYRFELQNTGTGVALYLNNVLVKEFTVAPGGFDISTMKIVTEDWQDYRDPIAEHDWLVFRVNQGVNEYTLTEVECNLNNFEAYESRTRDMTRVSDYIVRHRVHVDQGQSNSFGLFSFTLNDELFARRPTLGNSPSIEWVPVNNTIDWQ